MERNRTLGNHDWLAIVIGVILGIAIVAIYVGIYSSRIPDARPPLNSSSDHRELDDDLSWPARDFQDEVTLREQIAQSSIRQLLSLLLQSDNRDSSTGLSLLQQIVLEKLIDEDPTTALHEITNSSLTNSHKLVSTFFQQWASSHLDEAVSQARKLEDKWKYTAFKGIGVATVDLGDSQRQDLAEKLQIPVQFLNFIKSEELITPVVYETPHVALDLVREDGVDDKLQRRLLYQIAQSLLESEGIQVVYKLYDAGIEWSLRQELITGLLEKYAQSNPSEALEKTSSVFQDDLGVIRASQLVRKFAIGAIAETDPVFAMGLVNELTDISYQEQGKLWITTIKKWAEKNPQELKDSLPTIPRLVRYDALIHAAQSLNTDFEQALVLSDQMIFHAVKKAFLTYVAKQKVQSDPFGTLEWVKTRPELQDFREDILADLVVELAGSNPMLAMDIVKTHGLQSGVNSIENLALNVIRHVAKKDAEMALELIPMMIENSTSNAYIEVGFAFLSSGLTDSVLEVGTHLSTESQANYHELIFMRWAMIDPSSLYESISQLPTKALKSKAAFHLIQNKWQEELSQLQLNRLQRMLTREDSKILRDFAE